MSFRIEDKLYINENNLHDFKKFLEKKSANKVYTPRTIESLYFDNQNFQIHNDSIEGLVPRKKIRIRKYQKNQDSNIYYEIKNSSVEGRFKTRKIINSQKANELISKGIFDNQYGICLPKLYVTYDREYLFFKDVRISIDTNITYRSYDTNFENSCIGITKFNYERIVNNILKDILIFDLIFGEVAQLVRAQDS